jgi:NAD(P)H-hydrate epimerase
VETALQFLEKVDAFALGPGITTQRETRDFVRDVVRRARCPGVVDADALNGLEGQLQALTEAHAFRVLTPHPGECARLLGKTVAEVQADRDEAARELARRTGAVVVLKGRETVVTDGEKRYRNDTGNPGMASGGTGDVLTGVVAGLLAGGASTLDAAVLGAWVHGRAGDLASERVGEISCTAVDVLDALGPAFVEAIDGQH